ncbi:hypothetical protein NEF87_002716 [Candidatus Lokiarchaeum ossiferum]|uniref:Type II secretion system protein GspF domain-containing protein n=1 Tax=Candidatus Lokiarchaeum ossiferum TaxID=2951803 RepID=A0ABY6HSN2_9ARCH|nr:hypothetical protein NEF87_002716 [Candidatus Lokiarchaeum sp. B-35]
MNFSKIINDTYFHLCSKLPKKNNFESKQEIVYEDIIRVEYNLTKSQQMQGAYLLSMGFFIVLCIAHYIWQFDMIYLIFLICIGFLIFTYLKNYFKNQIKVKEYSLINHLQFLVVQIKIFLKNVSKTKDREILILEMLTYGPKLSPNIDQVYYSLSLGKNSKKSLEKLIFYSPAFTKFFQTMIKFNFDEKIVSKLDEFNSSYEKKIEMFIQSLETRLSLFFFFSIFYPIGVFYFAATYPISFKTMLMLVLIYYLAQEIILKYVLDNRIHLLGDVSNLKKKKKNEFETFLDFFLILGRNLINSSPEIAIFEAFKSIGPKSQEILKLSNFNFSLEFLSLEHFLNKMSQTLQNSEISQFLNFLLKLFKNDSSQGYNFLIDTLIQINSHKVQVNKQEVAFKNAYSKSNLFKMLLALILGILTPFIIKFQATIVEFQKVVNSSQDFYFEYSTLAINQSISLVLRVISLLFLIINITSFNRFYIKRSFKKIDFLVIILYIIFNLISNILLQNTIL